MDQGSQEWKEIRLGKVTASRVADVIAKTKAGWGASRKSYMAQLISETLTGVPADSFTSDAMRHGIDTEPLARKAYEFAKDVDVTEVGFVDHPKTKVRHTGRDEIRRRRGEGETLKSIANDYGVSFQTISDICIGRRSYGSR